jgi:hypothetical protein
MNASQNTDTASGRRGRTGRTGRIARTGSIGRSWGVVAVATAVVALSALPAAARQDPGQVDAPAQSTSATYFCTLGRVGTQFVACDNLTGNGVPAPRWVREVR